MKYAILFLIISATGYGADFSVTNNDFKEIYNNYRRAAPQNIPWPGSYWAYGKQGIANTAFNVAQRYDAKFSTKAAEWENTMHSCESFKGTTEMYQSCNEWWGHCNAWSAAAIKYPEPRNVDRSKNSYMKGLLTELWMDSGSLFTGTSEKNSTIGKWVCDSADWRASAFWDVTPKDTFLIFTNYIGILKMGLAIDRYTGDQVWNQPIAAYVILPIQDSDIKDPSAYDRRINSDPNFKKVVSLKMKIVWAEDAMDGDRISSSQFSLDRVKDTIDEEEFFGNDFLEYSTRVLRFKLYFDGDVKMANGQITESGNIIGGNWEHHEMYCDQNKTTFSDGTPFNLNATHPDFIWAPTDLENYSTGSKNVYITEKQINDNTEASPAVTPISYEFKVPYTSDFDLTTTSGWVSLPRERAVADNLYFVFSRENIAVAIEKVNSIDESTVSFVVKVFSGQDLEALKTALTDSGVKILDSKKL